MMIISHSPTGRLSALCALLLITFLPTSAAQADWEKGVAAFRAGDLAAAETEFRAVAEASPDSPAGHLMLGQTLVRADREAEAVSSLERALALDSKNTTALGLAQVYLRLQRPEDARRVLASRTPDDLPRAQQITFHTTAARAAQNAQLWEDALTALERALALEPENTDLLHDAATAALEIGRVEYAIETYRRSAEIQPDLDTLKRLTLTSYNHAVEGPTTMRTERCAAALPHAQAWTAEEETTTTLNVLANVASCAQEPAVALDSGRRAAALAPETFRPHETVGNALLELERWKEAAAAFKIALQYAPEDLETKICGRQAFAYEHLEQWQAAEKGYRCAGDDSGVDRVTKAHELAELERQREELEIALAEVEAEENQRRAQF